MPPLRRSQRLKRRTKAGVEEERLCTREKKRRELCPANDTPSPSADMDLSLMSSVICSDESKLLLDATAQLLNLVSVENNPLISEVIQSGAVPRLVEFLKRDDNPQLQCVAARVLKNIAGGISENTQVVIECGAVPVFVKLLESSELETCEQVVWSLGNIAGESSVCRDIVLDCGALHPLLTLLQQHKSLSFLRIGTWTLANIFEGGPQVPFEQPNICLVFGKAPEEVSQLLKSGLTVKVGSEVLMEVLREYLWVLASLIVTTDELVLKEACWALLYLSHCGGGIETAIYEADLCTMLAILFKTAPVSVMYPATWAIKSILKGIPELDERALKAKGVTACYKRNDVVVSTYLVEEIASVSNFVNASLQKIIWKWMDAARLREAQGL